MEHRTIINVVSSLKKGPVPGMPDGGLIWWTTGVCTAENCKEKFVVTRQSLSQQSNKIWLHVAYNSCHISEPHTSDWVFEAECCSEKEASTKVPFLAASAFRVWLTALFTSYFAPKLSILACVDSRRYTLTHHKISEPCCIWNWDFHFILHHSTIFLPDSIFLKPITASQKWSSSARLLSTLKQCSKENACVGPL